jgi:hypothetical protein
MEPYPDTPLGEFTVKSADSMMVCEHYFPSDYDEDGSPVGERHKAVVSIAQNMVLVEVRTLRADTENGSWKWETVNSIWFSLVEFLAVGANAAFSGAHR